MKHERIAEALNRISDKHIEEASGIKRKRPYPWIAAAAAVLAIIFLLGMLPVSPASDTPDPILQDPVSPTESTGELTAPSELPASHLKLLAAAPSYPRLSAYPTDHDSDAYDAWWTEQRALHDQPEGYADNLVPYFGSLICRLLKQTDDGNVACSPVSIYMALAMLAETTAGESQQQLLTLLRAPDMETLRTQAKQVWEGHYNDDGVTTSILAGSLWLDEGCSYNEETVQLLAEQYYASVFRAELGSEDANSALQDWLNEQTKGLLQEQAGQLKLDPRSVMALATTVFYQVQWLDEFRQENNTQGVFNGATGQTNETYMNRTLYYNPYFWSDNFGAMYLDLEDGSRMWLILPDEGVRPEQILEEATRFLSSAPTDHYDPYQNQKNVIINLSLPKFDIASDMELSDYIQALGVTDIFQAGVADFSGLIPQDDGGYVSQIQHAARVAIDEKGVTAAAFTVIDRCGAAMPPEEEIDFVLDRPFLFYIESQDGLPLFTGIVNEP